MKLYGWPFLATVVLVGCSGRDDLKTGRAEIDFQAAESEAPGAPGADDWLGHLGSLRNGRAAAAAWNQDWSEREPQRAWRVELGAGVSGAVVSGGRVYAIGNSGGRDVVRCLDLESGSEHWRIDYPCSANQKMFEGGPAATPQLDPDKRRLYVLSQEGELRCLSTVDGSEIWKRHLVEDFSGRRPSYGYAGAPLLAGNLLIVEPGGSGTSALALDAMSGERRWASGEDRASYAAPIAYRAGEQDGVACFNAYGLVGRSLADGTEQFRIPWETDYKVNAATPCYFGGHFFIISGYGKGAGLVSIAGDEASLLYETTGVMAQFQSPLRIGEQLFLVSGDNKTKAGLSCLNFADGRLLWSEPMSGNRGSLIAAGDLLIATSERGEVVLCRASPERYEELGRFQATGGRVWAQPALAAGRLLVRNNDGRLSCWDLR